MQDQVFVRNNDVGGGCVLYYWLEQLLCFAHEKCKTKSFSKIMKLVVVVSYIWLDQLICMACEKCKTKYLFQIIMLVLMVSYLRLDQLICMAV